MPAATDPCDTLYRRDSHGDPDPVFFLGYWRNDAATRAKFTGEVEKCLVEHAAVANAAVVPKPNAERGALVKA